jgi:hypothetical protein
MRTGIMSEVAGVLGARVRQVNRIDPNVYHRENNIDSDPETLAFREAVRFQCESMKADISSNGSYLVLELKADLELGVWSVNEPDRIFMTRMTRVSSIGCPVFAAGAVLSPDAAAIVHQSGFEALLGELDLGARESLHFYRNGVRYYAKLTEVTTFLRRVRFLSRFVAGIANLASQGSRHVDLPEPFSDLADLARAWAISDDEERAEALEGASAEDLKMLVERLAPRLARINEYLDSHISDSAAALGSLAEAACEAQIALRGAT